MINLRRLKDEIANDPLSRGYFGMTDAEVADDLNTKNRSRNRDTMSGLEVLGEVTNPELDALSDANLQILVSLTSAEDIDPFGPAARIIRKIFGAGSNTLAALAVARVEQVSRAVELDIGNRVREGHVQQARA